MSWKKHKLSELCFSISDGDHQPPPKVEQGIPFVTIANITSTNKFDFSNTMFVPQEYYNSLDNKRKAKKGDILYSVVGSFGTPVYMNEDIPFVFQRHIAILRPNENIVPRFLYYTMMSRDFYMMADAAAIGAAQRTVSLTSLRNMAISVPPLETQRRIASILSAYDDLIENNQKQIKLLEEAAQRLYKEWFVDLHFPGWEETKIVDGVPEGWEKYAFSEKVDIMSGGTPKTDVSEYYNGTIPFYTPKNSDGRFFAFDTITHISENGLNHCNSQLYPVGTVIITARGTVGKTTILAVPMAMNQSCYALKSDDLKSPYYLFFALNHEVAALKTMANGGVFDTIIVKTFERIHVWFPNNDLVERFEKIISPTMMQIQVKLKENTILKEARDRLLPKLMSEGLERGYDY